MKSYSLVFFLVGFSGLAFGQSADPVRAIISDGSIGAIKADVENIAKAVLTAVAFSGSGEAHPQLFDSALRQWREVAPGQHSRIQFANVTPPGGWKLEAAIFGNGETFGDADAIQAILAKRRATLRAIGIVLQHLPPSGNGTTSPQPLIPLFHSYKSEQLKDLADSDPVKIAIVNVNLAMERNIQTLAGETPDSIIAAVAAMLRDWQAALASSLPKLV